MDHVDLTTNLGVIVSKYPQTSATLRKFGITTSG